MADGVLAPGCIAQWMGRELFTKPGMNFANVVGCPRGGVAFLVSVIRKQRDGYVEWLAYVIVNRQCGWAPTNWLDKIA